MSTIDEIDQTIPEEELEFDQESSETEEWTTSPNEEEEENSPEDEKDVTTSSTSGGAGTTSSSTTGAGGKSPSPSGGSAGPKKKSSSSAGGQKSSRKTFKQAKPTMGGLVEVGTDVWAAWTGGKPKADWSGLDEPNPTSIKPKQYRLTSVSAASKSEHYRTLGMTTKFGRKKDLLTFERKLMEHLEENGLDTITYIPDPGDSTNVVSVVSDHGRFNHDEDGVKANDRAKKYFDKYDWENDGDAKKYLMACMDEDMEQQLYEVCDPKDCFIVCYLELVHIIRSVSVDRFDKMKQRIKDRKIGDYAGEDIELMASDYWRDYIELHGAGMYDYNLSLTMINAMMKADGSNEDFRSPLRTLKDKLNKQLLACRHMTYVATHRAMMAAGLGVKAILKEAKDKYRMLKDDGDWKSAIHAKDSKAMSKTYGSVNVAATNELKQMVNKLVQSMTPRDKSKDTCNKCGQPGHWARDCPKNIKGGRNNDRNGGKPGRNNFGKKGSGRFGKPGSGTRSPRAPPPKSGESEIKFIDGKKRYWCSKCNRWTESHGTDGHKSTEELKKQRDQASASAARVSFDFHPSAYKAVVAPTMIDVRDGYHFVDTSETLGTSDQSSQSESMTIQPKLSWTIKFLLAVGYIPLVYIMMPQFLAAASLTGSTILQHWMWCSMTMLSGIIGFGTSWWITAQVPSPPPEPKHPEPVRIRTGPQRNKQIWRHFKKEFARNKPCRNGRRRFHCRVHGANSSHSTATCKSAFTPIPPRFLRRQVHPASKYNNIGRKGKTFHGPTVWSLERRVSALEATIRRMRNSVRQTEVDPANLYHWDTTPQGLAHSCAMADIVDVGHISSSRNEREENKQHEVGNVLFDSGANCCITNRKEDFCGHFETTRTNQVIDGIGKGLQIAGKGTVTWTFKADNGMYRTLKVPCYYVPSSNSRIASLQVILKEYPNESAVMDGTHLRLTGDETTPPITIPYCAKSNLPFAPTTMAARSTRSEPEGDDALVHQQHPSLTIPANINLTEQEKEVIRWHQRLGHISTRKVQWLMRQGLLSSSERTRRLHQAACKLTQGPMCTACQYAKQRRRTTPGTTRVAIKEEQNALKTNNLFPGSMISVDHFQCNPLGRLLNTYGREKADDKYKGGCIFVDHASGYIHIELQVRLNTKETLTAKKEFEGECSKHGVIPQNYLTDQGSSFTSDEFNTHLGQFKQTIRHAAPGGHHANGIAERNISTIMSISRAMLHHAAIHWPDVADVELWPLALHHAVYILNRIPREDSGRSPLELFGRKTWPTSKFQDFHVWGSPAYVLDSTLAAGRTIPRWKPRSSRSVFVGNSTKQGHGVPLVLNLDTGKITSQYHVIVDNWFQTVEATAQNKINFDSDDWYKTFGLTEWQYVPDDSDEPQENNSPVGEVEGANQREQSRATRDSLTRPQTAPAPTIRAQPAPKTPDSNQREPSQRDFFTPSPEQREPSQRDFFTRSPGHSLQRENDPPVRPLPTTGVPPVLPSNRTPPRVDAPLKESSPPVSIQRENNPAREAPTPPAPTKVVSSPQNRNQRRSPRFEPPQTRSRTVPRRSPRLQNTGQSCSQAESLEYPHSEWLMELYAGKARKANNDPDTLTWDEAMASPYRQEFVESAQRELDELVDKETWYEDLKDNATTGVVPCKWVFRIKRTSDGTIRKFKGRIVLRGDLQKDTGEDNFSPVAAWPTVRGFLVISVILGWITTSIDFSNAFVQSYLPADNPVWMAIPRGYRSTKGPAYCLKLVKSLYGHKNAPILWFKHSAKAFKKLGLYQSKYDECLWYGKDIMVVQYVDDCGISAPTQERIDKFVADLHECGLELTQEESFEEFLGIKFRYDKDGSIECTQKGLIQKILTAAGMKDCNPNSTSAIQSALASDKDGEPMTEDWNYRGICGMLLYLSTNTRPDIAFAVSQVCRFSAEPKKSHATAVKTILRYLKKTCDKGMLIKPTLNKLHLDLYVDADFCGLFGQEDCRNPDSVRSRTGYVAILGGWPIIWKSQLQTHLSQSTLEAEYTALSASLRTFLPLQWLIEEMIKETKCSSLSQTKLHSTVFEDNQSTYLLATNQRITNRTKYLLGKWHWFWDLYKRQEEIKFSIIKCPTDQMSADYLTKPLSKALFESNRERVQGW